MINFEAILSKRIARRFKSLRGIIPPEIIANGQKSQILSIEKEKIPKSGNFVSDTLLDAYSDYFGKSKSELIFGDSNEKETQIFELFHRIFLSVYPDELREKSKMIKDLELKADPKVMESFTDFFHIFGDFGRWYNLKQHELTDAEEDIFIDFDSMYYIFWSLSKNKIMRSFQEKVISTSFTESDNKFYFNRINDKVNRWLINDFSSVIIPDMLEKLKTDSIFKIGFLVKNLIDEFLVKNLSESFLENIPLQEYFPPVKSYHFNLKEGTSQEEIMEASEELLRFFSQEKKRRDNETPEEFYQRIEKEKFFENNRIVEDMSRPFINGTRKISAEGFLNSVLDTPEVFDTIHNLNLKERKIPGILTVNSQASKLFQQKVNEVVLSIIDDLVRYQNIFINCIKWEELQDFI